MRLTEQYYKKVILIQDLLTESKKLSDKHTKQLQDLSREIDLCLVKRCKSSNISNQEIKELLDRENKCRDQIKKINNHFYSHYEFLQERIHEEHFKLDKFNTLLQISKDFERLFVMS